MDISSKRNGPWNLSNSGHVSSQVHDGKAGIREDYAQYSTRCSVQYIASLVTGKAGLLGVLLPQHSCINCCAVHAGR
jgi:hypothetical protein